MFFAMINDLNITGTLQNTVNEISDWSKETKFQLNSSESKELRINFTKQSNDELVNDELCELRNYDELRNDELVKIDGQCFEVVKSVKVLGLTITDDLKWNSHVQNIVFKASKRFYLLKHLKQTGIDEAQPPSQASLMALMFLYTAWISCVGLRKQFC